MRRLIDPATGRSDAARRCRALHAAKPVPYHRMATLRPEWTARSRVLLTVLAALLAYVIMASALLVVTVLLLALIPGLSITLGVASGDPTSALDVGLALAMGALWLPAGLIAVRFGGWRPAPTAWSVACGLRRRMMLGGAPGMLLGALVVVVAAAGAGTVSGRLEIPVAAAAVKEDAPRGAGRRVAVIVVALLLAPLQAVGMELALRGVVLQALGARFAGPWPGVVVTALLALVGRDLHPAVLVPAVVLALCAAVLTWKSGGIEVPVLLTGGVMLFALIGAALLAGTSAGAGLSAMVGATAAPGTSAAALTEAAAAAPGDAALVGGLAGSLALLAVTAVVMQIIGTRESVRFLEPVGREATEGMPPALAV